MGKKILFETLRRSRANNVAYLLDAAADRVRDDMEPDGAIVILSVGGKPEVYQAGILLDKPQDAMAILLLLVHRVRQQIERSLLESD